MSTLVPAQSPTDATKDVDVRVKRGEATVTITETVNGHATTEVITGAEAEEYIANEKAGISASASARGASTHVHVIRRTETDEEGGSGGKRKSYRYNTVGSPKDVMVVHGDKEGITSSALTFEVSDDKRSITLSCAPPDEGDAIITITGPNDEILSKETLAPGNKIDRTIDLKKHGTGTYTAKLRQGGTAIVKMLVIE